MRAKAYPGEDPETAKNPAVAGEAIARLIEQGFETGHRIRLES
jgi:hypothetical protein